jgi:hypothetical protein
MSAPNFDVAYATGTSPVTLPSGVTIRVQKGSHWPAGDPVVQARPDLFSTDPRWGMQYTVEPDGYDAPAGPSLAEAPARTEQATAAPGERRNARRG